MLFYDLKERFQDWLDFLDIKRDILDYLHDNYSTFDVITGRWRYKPTIDARKSKLKRLKYSKVGYKPPKVKIRRRRVSHEKAFLN